MKTLNIVVALVFSIGVGASAQVAGSATSVDQSTVPAPTPYRVVDREANHNVWQNETYEKTPDGQIRTHIHKYTELASGLNYLKNGRYVAAQEKIESCTGGAVARQGQYQVNFANNLNTTAAVNMQTPDGKRLRSNILGLSYYDNATGKSVQIAQVQNSQGVLISANQVLYADAFEGVKADVRYTYKKGSFEQDVILREQPPTPESFGLNSQTTEIEVITEFINPPKAIVKERAGKKSGTEDQDISWGTMSLWHGKAFDLESSQNSGSRVSVKRQYGQINGRDILLEIVPVKNIQPSLNHLPVQAGLRAKLPAMATKTRVLAQAPAAQPVEKPMELASTLPARQGYVLDYVEISADQTDFTFQSDTTYYVNGEYNLSGTTTIEGGTVIKYNTGNSSVINILGTVNCQTAAYRPAIFTSANDNTITGASEGNISTGSDILCTGSLSLLVDNESGWDMQVNVYDESTWNTTVSETVSANGSSDYVFTAGLGQTYYFEAYDSGWDCFYWGEFNPTLNSGVITMASDGSTAYTESGDSLCTPSASSGPAVALSLANGGVVHDVRIANVGVGIVSDDDISVVNAQFVNCNTALQTESASLCAGNILMSSVGIGFYGRNYQAAAENLTFDQGTILTGDEDGLATTSTLALTNCLLTVVGNNGVVPVTTNQVVNLPDNTGVYQPCGGGNYYLATNSPYRNYGTTSIDSGTLAQLRLKTTWAPVIFTNMAFYSPTSYSPQAARDTNSLGVDLGYHYDPLDYAFGGCDVYTNITFTAGTAVGWFRTTSGWCHAGQGIHLDDRQVCTFSGTATAPCYWVRLNTVQEADTTAGYGPGGITGWADQYAQDVTRSPEVHFNWVRCAMQATECGGYFRDDYGYLTVKGMACEFGSGNAGGYGTSLYFTNCLFDRTYVALTLGWAGNAVAMRNCTFHCCQIIMTPSSPAIPVSIQNCALDGASIDIESYGADPGYASYSKNAYTNSSNPFPFSNHDVVVTNFNWQSSWFGNYYLPSDSPLIDAGSTTADQVGLYHFTTQTSQVVEGDSIVDIGYHYVAVDPNTGQPYSTLTNGQPDYLVDASGNGLPDAWEYYWFGNYTNTASELDAKGRTLLSDYQNGVDPNVIAFTIEVANNYVNTSQPGLQMNITGGVPSYYTVLVDSTNFATTDWTAYTSSNLTASLGALEGWHEIWVGLKGLPADATLTWVWKRLKLDKTPPQLTITSPANGTVNVPLIQIAGFCPEPLDRISYDLTNALGLVTNLDAGITHQFYDTNTWDFTTNYFECVDVPLTNGVNTIILHTTDLAGNVTMTNFSVTVDYASATNPVVNLTWPQNGMELCGSSFTLRGWVDDPTASISVSITDTNGDTNLVSGVVERTGVLWAENLPLAEGTNWLTLRVTNAAGFSSTTNISVVKSDMTLTMNPLADNSQLWQPTVSVSGTISDASYAVWVNGVQGTNNGNGTWSADNVPVSAGGVASFDVSAVNGGDPAINMNIDKPVRLYVESYGEKDSGSSSATFLTTTTPPYTWTFNWEMQNSCSWGDNTNGAGSGWWKVQYGNDDGNGGFENAWDHSQMSSPASAWPDVAAGTVNDHYFIEGEGWGFPYNNWANDGNGVWVAPVVWERCNVTLDVGITAGWPYQWIGSWYPEAPENKGKYSRTADAILTLQTGGKALTGVALPQSVFQFTGSAAEVLDKRSYAVAGSGGFYIFGAVPTQPILATAITINGKALGSDGIMYRKLADNITVDVTPRVKNKDFYTFYVGASKHTLTSYTLHPALTDPNRERTQVGVGEEVSVYLDPPLDMTFPENPWWTVGGGGIDARDGSATTFIAASNACTATVTVHVRDVQLAKSFGVLEPSKPTAEITSTTGQRIPGAFPGAWMHLKLTLQPTSVSFYRVETIELECPASGITKYFTNHSPLSHGPAQFAGVWHGTDENNMITGGMDNCFYYDGENGIILMPTTGTDWYPGGEFIWDIQARWRILNTPSTEISLSWSAQHFKLDSNGTMTIDKFGQSVQRTIYDIITPTLP